jgi:hypothetical protein
VTELDLECRGIRLLARPASWLDQPEGSTHLVDLRKVTELGSLPDLKEKGIQRVSLPVTMATWSEQDVDSLRREFLRGKSPVVVLSGSGRRAALMVLMHVARAEGWTLEHTLSHCPTLDSQPYRQLLSDYLERHRRAE